MFTKKRKAELRQKLEAEFGKMRYPGDDNLVNGYTGEHEEIAEAFRGKKWQELPVPFLSYHHEAVFFFTPQAYCYYLPA
ncbi:MAG: hypothetical protein SF029_02770 [bacterium]|nr:hypothetical protein [bacterium]